MSSRGRAVTYVSSNSIMIANLYGKFSKLWEMQRTLQSNQLIIQIGKYEG